jgi:catechol 2,3-dioxygenase-like lactoylglutathione lyase family enzyme
MARTVDFYSNLLGMPLIKTLEIDGPLKGQHFFFDIGNGDSLAFFWFYSAPPAAPGVAMPDPARMPAGYSAIGSMNHLAFNIAPELIEAYHQSLLDKGIKVSRIYNHTNDGVSRTVDDSVFCRSIYFLDPDGILIEFCAWTRSFTAEDVRHIPATAADAIPTAPAGR